MRRVILLGASNLAMGFPRVRHALERVWDAPLEFFAALGCGRSYGMWSRFLHQELPGIVGCELWDALDSSNRQPTETFALLTDVGNDLLYGAPVEQIVEWVGTCLERLNGLQAQIVITQLPMESVHALSAWRYYAARALLFPTCSVTWQQIQERAEQLNDRLRRLWGQYDVRLIEQPERWYSLDPIHFRLTKRAEAWRTILSGWPSFPPETRVRPAPLAQRAHYIRMQPAVRRAWGRRRERQQPTFKNQRTTVALY